MAGTLKTNSVTLGDSATDSQNFQLRTNADGTATLARGAAGDLGDILTVDTSGEVAFPLMPFVGSAPVAESGSNVNGNYVKFADGTLICSRSIVGWSGSNIDNIYSLPVTAVGISICTWNSIPTLNIYMVNAIWNDSVSWKFRHSVASSTQPATLGLIGRWK